MIHETNSLRFILHRVIMLCALIATGSPMGCDATSGRISDASATGQYETLPNPTAQEARRALELSDQAALLIDEKKYDQAELLLRQALSLDLACGPAHNNLGKVYFHQDRHYHSAWEFQYAIRLMPDRPEPRNNLGLVFERVGKLPQAVEAYEKARNLAPDSPYYIGNLARARIRRGDHDESTRKLLEELIEKHPKPEWTAWAREKLATLKPAPLDLPASNP